jgi:hypothetical protein
MRLVIAFGAALFVLLASGCWSSRAERSAITVTCSGTQKSGSLLVGTWRVNTATPRITGNGTEVVARDSIVICDTNDTTKLDVHFPRDVVPGSKVFTVSIHPNNNHFVSAALPVVDSIGNPVGTLQLLMRAHQPSSTRYTMFGMFHYQPFNGSGDSGGTWGGGK